MSSGRDEGHLDVDLGELGLAVGPQVLVAEAAGELVVALEAGDHQQLLEQLRRLRQGVEAARGARGWARGSRARPPASSGSGSASRSRRSPGRRARAGPPRPGGGACAGSAAAAAAADRRSGGSAAPPRWPRSPRPRATARTRRGCGPPARARPHLDHPGRVLRIGRLPRHDPAAHADHVLRAQRLGRGVGLRRSRTDRRRPARTRWRPAARRRSTGPGPGGGAPSRSARPRCALLGVAAVASAAAARPASASPSPLSDIGGSPNPAACIRPTACGANGSRPEPSGRIDRFERDAVRSARPGCEERGRAAQIGSERQRRIRARPPRVRRLRGALAAAARAGAVCRRRPGPRTDAGRAQRSVRHAATSSRSPMPGRGAAGAPA